MLDDGELNWMGCYSYEFKRNCFSIFFNSMAKAEKAAIKLSDLKPKILKTPSFVNNYFKYSLFILD